jgi:hypothetical protein
MLIMPQTLSDWVTLLGMVGGFFWWVLEYRKTKRVNVNVDADTMTKYAALLQSAAARELAYQKQIDGFEPRVKELEKRAYRLELWGKRLSAQVILLHGTPITLESIAMEGD